MRAKWVVIGVAFIAVTQWGCARPQVNARQAWQQVLEPCVGSDVLGEHVIYLGPSNNVGVGAMWRQRADGSYALVWTTEKIRNLPAAVRAGNDINCAGESSRSFNGKIAGSLLTSALVGLSGDASAEVNKASTVNVTVEGVREEKIMEGVFNQWWQRNQDSDYAKDAAREGRLIMTTAYRVKGMKATLKYKGGGATRAAAAFQNPSPVAEVKEVKADLQASATNDNTLVITAAKDFYILGSVGRYDPAAGELGAGAKVIKPAGRPKTERGLDKLTIEPQE